MNEIIYQRGLKKELKKQNKLQKKYDVLCSSFNFIINPYEIAERYVVIEGSLFRVRFSESGISVTDSEGQFITDKLTRLQVLNQLKEQQ